MKKIMNSVKVKYAMLAMIVIASLGVGFTQLSPVARSGNCSGNAPTEPTFNYWPLNYNDADCTDAPLIDAKNQSLTDGRDSRYATSQSEHDQGITANVGDAVRIKIYFHNGASDQIDRSQTTATNAVVSSRFDTTAGTVHTASATLSASNAASVSSASKGGDIKINTPGTTALEYIPRTALLCLNYDAAVERGADLNDTCGFNNFTGKPMIAIPISDSINNGSFSLGDLKACFPYAGFLVYSVRVVQASNPGTPGTENPSLSITKQVRNVTAGNSFSKNTNANNGDTVEFKIDVKNTSNVTATNVTITDALVSGLNYIGDNGLNTGMNIGSLAAGETKTITFQARVNITSGTITNTASASADNVTAVRDSATVTVTSTPVTPTTKAELSVLKQVRNVTAGENEFKKSTTAKNGDIIEFKVIGWNVGNADIPNLRMVDTMPAGLTGISEITGGARVLLAGGNVGFFPRAKVTVDSGTLVNTATISGDNVASASDTATVVVSTPSTPVTPTAPLLSVLKQVRNVTAGETEFKKVTTAKNGDIVEYKIIGFNVGNGDAQDIKMVDELPAGLTGISGLTGGARTLLAGGNVGFFAQAKVTVNSGTLVNKATISGSNVGPASDTATVNVSTPVVTTHPAITITKDVRDITLGTGFATNLDVRNGDLVEYRLVIRNTGDVNLTNVLVNDNLPSGVTLIPSTVTTTKGTAVSNGISVSTLAVNDSFTVTYRATVNQTSGTIVNSARVTSTEASAGPVSATLNVIPTIVPPPTNFQIGISKLVRNVTTNTSYQKSVNAVSGQIVNFQVTVTNLGNAALSNVNVTDTLPAGLSFTTTAPNMFVGTLNVGQSRTFTFDAMVNSGAASTLTNVAIASSSNTGNVQDSATVFVGQVNGGFVNIVQSKKANNDTKNVDATTVAAERENFITYTLTTTNTGNAPATNYIVSDDLTNVLSLAGMVDLNGGVMNGSVISWPAETIGAGQTVTHTFRVRVNYNLPARTGLQMVNTYGNTVVIPVKQGSVLGAILVAPATGANSMAVGIAVASLFTAAFWAVRRKNLIPSIKFR